MQPNKVKSALRAGGTVAGPIIAESRTVGAVKLMAVAGFDFLFIDTEHSMFDMETVVAMVQMSLMCGITPLVRPTDNTYADVARSLDSGAQGVIIPRVENGAQAAAAVSYAKYPPLGRRGAGGAGRNAYERRTPLQAVEESNAETMVIVQIESPQSVDNLEEIASVPGVDVLLIGPQDLSINLGIHGQHTHPTFLEAAQRVASVASAHGLASGMVENDVANLRRWYDMGMRFLVCNSDTNMLTQGASRDVQALNEYVQRA
jgi:2-dehydro-3-deoxyglucarate aldolase/4-hydroxy-2-oxoheptanedioate aldolase